MALVVTHEGHLPSTGELLEVGRVLKASEEREVRGIPDLMHKCVANGLPTPPDDVAAPEPVSPAPRARFTASESAPAA